MIDVQLAAVVIMFLAAQTGAFLYWTGKITQQVRDHEGRIVRLEFHEDKSEAT